MTKKILICSKNIFLNNLLSSNLKDKYELKFIDKINESIIKDASLLIIDDDNYSNSNIYPIQTIVITNKEILNNISLIHFLKKPIRAAELLDMIDELSILSHNKVIIFSECVIDLNKRIVQKISDKTQLKLTEFECKILDFFLSDIEKTKSNILKTVWDHDSEEMIDTGVATIGIAKLKTKLRGAGINEIEKLLILNRD